MAWLIITEKNDTAKRIASILFDNVEESKKYGVPFYQSNGTYVVGLKGHIVALDFPQKYNNWKNVPFKSLLKAEIVKETTSKNIARLLESVGKEVDEVTVATDYDREGELIGMESLEFIKKVNPGVKVNRARYSAITPQDIKQAFSNLTEVDENLAKAAETRQKIDLIWGSVLTRLISIASGRLGSAFLSVGRVQSPTLRIITEREKEIENFVPRSFWEITAIFSRNGEEFDAKHVERFWEKEKAEKAFSRIGKEGKVTKFDKKERTENKPIPFNTTEFLREASKFMSPYRAMSVAEGLYMNGLISYPRTDNTVYPQSLNVKSIASQFKNSSFSKEAEIVLSQKRISPSRGKKETKDHPPIYPTAVVSPDKLSGDDWKIYELVVRRFLATLAPNAVWEVKNTKIDVNGEQFWAMGKKLIQAGWRSVYTYVKTEEFYLPDLEVGEILAIVDKELLEKETKPPGRHSTSNLIKIMESQGLGTKSTRHETIKKLYGRKYVFGNPPRPTQTAHAVIEALKNNAETITLPEMTSRLEQDMDKIAEGKEQEEKVVKKSTQFLDEILSNIDKEKLSKSLKEEVRKDKIIGKCPECGNDLVIRRTRGKNPKRFIGCSGYPNCNFTLPLPQKGTIYPTQDECDKHKIKKIKIKTKKGYWEVGCVYCNYLKWKSENNKKGDDKS
ncbi:MAG: DNA topoisomerase I [Halobacteriota archaeon]